MKYLQKLGKALMLPVAALPVAGILMGVGYLLAPGVMGVPGAETAGAAYTVGFLLVKAGGALIDNMAWLFAIGAAVGLADDHDGTAGLAGLVAFLMIQQLLNPAVVGTVRGMDADAQAAWLLTAEGIAFSKIAATASSASSPPSSVAPCTTSSRTPVSRIGWPSSPASAASPS